MKTQFSLMLLTLLTLTLSLGSWSEAYAARMGGGKSFGSRPSYSAPYQRSTSPTSPGYSRPGTAAQQPAMSPAQQRNQSLRDGLAQRSGFGRFLGGLALGGLLGALFMGGGFEHINFLDILVFAGIAFLLMKMFAARRDRAQGVFSTPQQGHFEGDRQDNSYQRQSNSNPAGFDTDIFARKGGAPQSPESVVMPSDFDAPAFIDGAKNAYEMMQKAWDLGDLADLRALTTDKVFAELQDQIRARGQLANKTDLLKVDAEILEVRDVGPDREVAVLFDVLMREDPSARPSQVREVWHFTRAHASRQPTWFLDGIQQLED